MRLICHNIFPDFNFINMNESRLTLNLIFIYGKLIKEKSFCQSLIINYIIQMYILFICKTCE